MKNKTFYYTKELKTVSKMYGNRKYTIKVYGVKRNKLYYIGEAVQNSAATPGDKGEVWYILQAAGEAPKTVDLFNKMFLYCRENNINIQAIADL